MLISHEAVCFIQIFNENDAVFWIIIQITVVSLYLKQDKDVFEMWADFHQTPLLPSDHLLSTH